MRRNRRHPTLAAAAWEQRFSGRYDGVGPNSTLRANSPRRQFETSDPTRDRRSPRRPFAEAWQRSSEHAKRCTNCNLQGEQPFGRSQDFTPTTPGTSPRRGEIPSAESRTRRSRKPAPTHWGHHPTNAPSPRIHDPQRQFFNRLSVAAGRRVSGRGLGWMRAWLRAWRSGRRAVWLRSVSIGSRPCRRRGSVGDLLSSPKLSSR